MATKRSILWVVLVIFPPLAAIVCGQSGPKKGQQLDPMAFVRVRADGQGFVRGEDNRPFVPWGFNYDHDSGGELLESYWHDQWDAIVEDFLEMKAMGANVARVHLQFGAFFPEPDRPNEANVQQLRKLIRLAEETDVLLDITGLGCYLKEDVPEWYDALDRNARWAAQARFWRLIASVCAESPGVFCYDLMNEPVVPGARRRNDWLGPPFAGKYHFVQFIALETGGKPRAEIARLWTQSLVRAIRELDRHHLITVGLVPWSLPRPGLTSGFDPAVVGRELDFLAVHMYPRKGRLDEAVETLKGFAEAKRPVIVEELFPLRCGIDEAAEFVLRSRGIASGWISFYWGKTIEELEREKTLQAAVTAAWLKRFRELREQVGVPD